MASLPARLRAGSVTYSAAVAARLYHTLSARGEHIVLAMQTRIPWSANLALEEPPCRASVQVHVFVAIAAGTRYFYLALLYCNSALALLMGIIRW